MSNTASSTATATADLAAQLRRVPTSTATVVLHDLGIDQVVMQGIHLLTSSDGSSAGPARTLRFLPARGDVRKGPRGSINRALVDSLDAGEILVIDAAGHMGGAVLGDMMAARSAVRGAAAVVADGVMRDIAGISSVGLAVFARGAHPAPNSFTLVPWDADVPIQCGGVLVRPGDWILGDGDAVIVIPESLVEQVAEKGNAITDEEEFCARLLAAGFPLDEAYPLPAARRADFERFRADGTVPAYNG